MKVLIIGGGICGITGSISLAKAGHDVVLVDQGPIPSPLAASTDISKIIRGDYGADELYTNLMMAALDGWEAWNRHNDGPLFHETGFLMLARQPMAPGSFEYEGFTRAKAPERIADTLSWRFPRWNPAIYPDGYYNPRAGWAESGAVVSRLAVEASSLGVDLRQHQRVGPLRASGNRIIGALVDGTPIDADITVVAAGTWTTKLVPALGHLIRSVGQPVVHFLPKHPERFRGPEFPTWAADISRTGWYGFPALADGRLKVANHGPGRLLDADAPREVLPIEIERTRAFLRESLPELADAPVVHTRLCLYCDTTDGDFIFDRDPAHDGLIVAAGGSGHLFKFAPLIGNWIADLVAGNPALPRFHWRTKAADHVEAARYTGDESA